MLVLFLIRGSLLMQVISLPRLGCHKQIQTVPPLFFYPKLFDSNYIDGAKMDFIITTHLAFVIFGFVLTAICAYLFYDERGVDFSATTGGILIAVSLAPLLNIFSALVLSMVVFREMKKRFDKS
jgi:hypothetical protein